MSTEINPSIIPTAPATPVAMPIQTKSNPLIKVLSFLILLVLTASASFAAGYYFADNEKNTDTNTDKNNVSATDETDKNEVLELQETTLEPIETAEETPESAVFESKTYGVSVQTPDDFTAIESNGVGDELFGGSFNNIPRLELSREGHTISIFKYADAIDMYTDEVGPLLGVGAGPMIFTFDTGTGQYKQSRMDLWGVRGEPGSFEYDHSLSTMIDISFGDEPTFQNTNPEYKVEELEGDGFKSFLVLYTIDNYSISEPTSDKNSTPIDFLYSEDTQFVTFTEIMNSMTSLD